MAAARDRDRDLELLIPVAAAGGGGGGRGPSPDDGGSKTSSTCSTPDASHHHNSSKEAFFKFIRSWTSKKFMTGCVILSPITITFYVTWWFINFVDGFFSPIYNHLGINVFGFGFITSISFIFLVGVFMSSWWGASVLGLGEWFIKKMPLVSYIYSASKQISAAISPDESTRAFKEVAIIRHPRIGEYAFGFITSTVILQRSTGEEKLCCVYVPTNHLYIGDIFLINSNDVMRPNLSVREGIEIVISGGMSIPQILTTIDAQAIMASRIGRSPIFTVPQIAVFSSLYPSVWLVSFADTNLLRTDVPMHPPDFFFLVGRLEVPIKPLNNTTEYKPKLLSRVESSRVDQVAGCRRL